MKITYKLLAVLVLGCGLFLTNCKDEEKVTPDTRTKVQIMMDGTWKWTASTCNVPVDLDGKDGASTDLLIQTPLCETDDTYAFAADSTYTGTSNVKCGSEGKTYKGDWMFFNNETMLDWDGDDYEVVEVSASKFVLRYTETKGPTTYIITDTYTH